MKFIIGIFLIEAISGDQKVSKVPILCETSSDCTGNFLISQYFLRVEETFLGILPHILHEYALGYKKIVKGMVAIPMFPDIF